jgi:hypothetical protein
MHAAQIDRAGRKIEKLDELLLLIERRMII